MFEQVEIANNYDSSKRIVVHNGDCLELLKQIPDASVQLIITSPPYNIGKEYEKKKILNRYVEQQAAVIKECVRTLSNKGSICWQIGNYVDKGAIIPLDTALYPIFSDLGLKMRNRIIWHFEHGLHCSKRFSGRYETVIWFTKSDRYLFNLDPVRVPQIGKNPGDIWVIPNVKSNHIEKTIHPCQFPVELIERFVLSMTNENDWVLDPFLGTGTSIIAAIKHNRKGIGAELVKKYVDLTHERIKLFIDGNLRTRPMNTPVYDPVKAGSSLTYAPWLNKEDKQQMSLFEKKPIGDRYETISF